MFLIIILNWYQILRRSAQEGKPSSSKSQNQVLSLKFKIQSPEEKDWDWG